MRVLLIRPPREFNSYKIYSESLALGYIASVLRADEIETDILDAFIEDLSVEKVVEKMCHNPAILFRVWKRGFIRKGYFADLVLVDMYAKWTVEKENIAYKCKWSPLEGEEFSSKVVKTFVNGHIAYSEGELNEGNKGKRLLFNQIS